MSNKDQVLREVNKLKKPIAGLGAVTVLLLLATSVNASMIDSTPISNSGPFRHNVFHTASSGSDGQSGSILAWYSMNSGGGSWDAASGAFNLSVDLYGNSADAITQTNSIGSATSTGSLALANLQGDGGLFGTIDWMFDSAAASIVGFDSVTMYFEDSTYGSTGANTWNPNTAVLTLWGQSGWNPVTQDLEPGPHNLGMDLVASVVPIPAAVWLFGSGLLVLFGVSRRKF